MHIHFGVDLWFCWAIDLNRTSYHNFGCCFVLDYLLSFLINCNEYIQLLQAWKMQRTAQSPNKSFQPLLALPPPMLNLLKQPNKDTVATAAACVLSTEEEEEAARQQGNQENFSTWCFFCPLQPPHPSPFWWRSTPFRINPSPCYSADLLWSLLHYKTHQPGWTDLKTVTPPPMTIAHELWLK